METIEDIKKVNLDLIKELEATKDIVSNQKKEIMIAQEVITDLQLRLKNKHHKIIVAKNSIERMFYKITKAQKKIEDDLNKI